VQEPETPRDHVDPMACTMYLRYLQVPAPNRDL